MKKEILTLLAIVFCNCMHSQHQYGAALTHENDFFVPIGNEDENYTGGLKVEFMFPEIKKLKYIFIKWDGEVTNYTRIGFGGTAYTPQDLVSAAPVIGDRPYASLTFVNFGNTFNDNKRFITIQSDFILGMMGKPGPGNVQAHIHEHNWFWTDRPIPQGWDNQIGYDGAFMLNYNVWFQKLISLREGDQKNIAKLFRTYCVSKVDLGNYMINFQGGLKFSFFDKILDYNPNIPAILGENKKAIKFNFYVEPNVRIVGYNATLEGIMFNDQSVYKIDNSDVKRVIFEFTTGATLSIKDSFFIKYTTFGRSREFNNGKSFHLWGGLSLGINF